MTRCALLGLAVALAAAPLSAQDDKRFVARHIDERAAEYGTLAQSIWDLAEVGYRETESSALLQARLREAGFTVNAGVAGMPTAFVASYGSGSPVVALLAEFDALPGLSQARLPTRRPLTEEGAGHACGHHLFGAGSVAAAVATAAWMEENRVEGTVRVYGTPAEEGGAGKVYMVREGLFDDVDVTLHWHPSDANSASVYSTLANKSAKFRFHGRSAHAAAAPERGRSALDGVEAMNHMVNLLREHVPEQSRIHYVITSGGAAPNVVPDFAEVFYYVRHPDPVVVDEIFTRLTQAAEGAALGTQTRVEHEVIHGIYAMLPNEVLARAAHANLARVGGVSYSDDERRFAETLQTSFDAPPPLSRAAEVEPFEIEPGTAPVSTDVGDVSWVTPTVGLSTATWVPGSAAHSWQAVASGGTDIGNKGMIVAAKALAMTAIDLFEDPGLVRAATDEYRARVGPDFEYVPLLGDRAPPLDYRSGSNEGGTP